MQISTRAFLFSCVVVASPVMFLVQDAAAQDGSMKACGEKWQAAKAANATNGATWPTFLKECRAAMAAPKPEPAATPAATTAATAAAPAAKADAKPAASPVFPAAVSAKFAELRPAQARQKTCSEQYQANKASNGNAGLRWVEKGGGYWSLCNRKLKGA